MSSWYTTKERKALDVQGVVNLSPQVISTSLIPSAAEWNQGFRIDLILQFCHHMYAKVGGYHMKKMTTVPIKLIRKHIQSGFA